LAAERPRVWALENFADVFELPGHGVHAVLGVGLGGDLVGFGACGGELPLRLAELLRGSAHTGGDRLGLVAHSVSVLRR
jgi:hypothetical protein